MQHLQGHLKSLSDFCKFVNCTIYPYKHFSVDKKLLYCLY